MEHVPPGDGEQTIYRGKHIQKALQNKFKIDSVKVKKHTTKVSICDD